MGHSNVTFFSLKFRLGIEHAIFGKFKEKSPIPVCLQEWQILCQQIFSNDHKGKWP